MSPRDLDYVIDILSAARLIQTFLMDRDRSAFAMDLMCQSAVIRQLEIIGEATKRLSVAFRDNHPDVPWQKMAGMRDIAVATCSGAKASQNASLVSTFCHCPCLKRSDQSYI